MVIVVRSQRSKPRLFAGLFAIAFGAWIFLDGLIDVSRGLASKRWPTAEATLSHVEIVRGIHFGTDGNFLPRDVAVHYWYTVEGRRYTSNGLAFGTELKSIFAPYSQLSNLNAARPLLAHYNARNPERAVLHPGVTFTALLCMAFGLVGLLGAYVTFTGSSPVPGLGTEHISSVTNVLDRIWDFLFDR